MKTVSLIFLLVLSVITGTTQAQSKNKKTNKAEETEQQFRETSALVESNRFRIEINRVHPTGGFDVSRFNPQGTIHINDTVAKGQLPYFGRAYSLPDPTEGGIKFDGKMLDQSSKIVQKKKRTSITYEFNVRTINDVYRFYIEIAPGGACTVNLNSNNRKSISYSGQIYEPEQEKDGK